MLVKHILTDFCALIMIFQAFKIIIQQQCLEWFIDKGKGWWEIFNTFQISRDLKVESAWKLQVWQGEFCQNEQPPAVPGATWLTGTLAFCIVFWLLSQTLFALNLDAHTFNATQQNRHTHEHWSASSGSEVLKCKSGTCMITAGRRGIILLSTSQNVSLIGTPFLFLSFSKNTLKVQQNICYKQLAAKARQLFFDRLYQ